MGLLPILVTLLGFIFLWTIVNYSSLVNFRNQINETTENLKALLNSLHTEIKSISIEQQANDVATLATLSSESINAISMQQWQQIKQLATKHENSNLQTLAQGILAAQRKYDAARKYYNQTVSQRPSSYVAKVFGFRLI